MLEKAKSEFFYKTNRLDEFGNTLEIPKMMLTNEPNPRPYNIQNFRNNRLNNASPFEIELAKYIPNALREVPIPITDLKSWTKSLKRNLVSETSFEYIKTFNEVDFLVPSASLIIEVDSDYHIGKENLDQARDEYLQLQYGLEVIRILGINIKKSIKLLKQRINERNPLGTISFKSSSDKYFDYRYQNIISIINNLIDTRLDFSCPTSKISGIIFTRKDLKEIYGWNISLFNELNTWSKKYLRKDLILLDIENLTSHEIFRRYLTSGAPKDKTYYLLKQLGYL